MRKLNPRLIYGSISGYGTIGPWAGKPGQDLLIQSLSGLAWLNGDADQPPMPFALSVADSYTGAHLVEGILSCLIRREITGLGGLVEVSLLASVLDLQFEAITTYLNDGHRKPCRSEFRNAHPYLAAPYGIYDTSDGYIALAMIPIPLLGQLIGCKPLERYGNPNTWHTLRDEIKTVLADFLAQKPTQYWLSLLEPADVWCANVLTWDELMESEAFKALDMTQEVHRSDGIELDTTCCPIRIDSQRYKSGKAAPRVGHDNNEILGPISEYFSNHAR
jgi:crotonobetainyl-CoA:carnitine CoA-transferase CaiB-like acyl-CoA transferase